MNVRKSSEVSPPPPSPPVYGRVFLPLPREGEGRKRRLLFLPQEECQAKVGIQRLHKSVYLKKPEEQKSGRISVVDVIEPCSSPCALPPPPEGEKWVKFCLAGRRGEGERKW